MLFSSESNTDGPIVAKTLSEAIEAATAIIARIERAEEIHGMRPVALHGSFGTWFRGHADRRWQLLPSVFRPLTLTNGVRYEEGNLFHHFQLLAPEHHTTHRNAFDWLCLMQHYGLPTRLIDWTENLLTALYFATSEQQDGGAHSDVNGRVFILAPRILNRVRLAENAFNERGVFLPESFHSAARAVLAKSATRAQWEREIAGVSFNGASWDAESLEKFTTGSVEADPSPHRAT
jgi:hypothetical protein